MVMPSYDKDDPPGHERTCACGCAMIWYETSHMWLCTHCDLELSEDELANNY